MGRNSWIIIGLVIVVIALVAGFALMMQSHAKEDTKLTITSAKSLEEGDKFSVKLTDLNGTSLEGKDVNVLIINKKGKVVKNESLKTNINGKAKLSLDLKKGKYTVEATFAGDENYTNSSVVQKLKIKEKEVVEEPADTQVSSTESSSQQSSSNGIVESHEAYDDDIAGGQNMKQNTYEDGDVEHYYEDGSYDYYDIQTGTTYYKTSDGEYGVDSPYD